MAVKKVIIVIITVLTWLITNRVKGQTMPDSLINELERTYNKNRKLEVLWEIILATYETNPDTALYYAHKQQKLAEEVGNEEKFVRAIWSRGVVYHERGDLKKAADCFFESLSLYRETNRQDKIAIALYNIGQVMMEGSDFNNALIYLKEASSLNTMLQDYQRVAKAQYEIARCYFEMANYEQSLFHLNQSLKMNNSKENKGLVSKTYNYMGMNYYKLKLYDKAIQEYSKARDYAVGLPDYDRKSAIAFNNIGEVYVEKGDFTKARSYYNKALDLKRKLEDPLLLAGTLVNLGKLALMEDQPSKAIPYLEEIILIVDKSRLSVHLTEASVLLAEAYKNKQELTTYDLQKIVALNEQYARYIHDLKQAGFQQSIVSTASKSMLEHETLDLKERVKKVHHLIFWIIGFAAIMIAGILLLLYYKERKSKLFIQRMWEDIKDI